MHKNITFFQHNFQQTLGRRKYDVWRSSSYFERLYRHLKQYRHSLLLVRLHYYSFRNKRDLTEIVVWDESQTLNYKKSVCLRDRTAPPDATGRRLTTCINVMVIPGYLEAMNCSVYHWVYKYCLVITIISWNLILLYI